VSSECNSYISKVGCIKGATPDDIGRHFAALTHLLLMPSLPSKLASNIFNFFELALASCEAHTFSLETTREQYVLEVLLTPSFGALEARIEDLNGAAKATTCQAKSIIVDPSEDSRDIDIKEYNSIIRPTKLSHVDFGKSKTKDGHIEVFNQFGYKKSPRWGVNRRNL
jgi:hypothetical protein